MANWLIAFLCALGVSMWVYAKLMRKTGNNTRSSVIAAVFVGVVLFIVMLLALSSINAGR